MIKIALVSSFMPPHLGGLEVAVKTIADGYRAAGYDTRWIASRVPKDLPAAENNFIRVTCWNEFERWFGVPWPIWGFTAIAELAKLIHWADVIHVHDCLYHGSLLATLIARFKRKPVILSQHIGFVSYPNVILNALERLAYATIGRVVLLGATHVAFCTPAAEEFVTELIGKTPFTASHIPYGIDTERFKPMPGEKSVARKALGLPEQVSVVLFAGRLVEKKGIDLFLEVARNLSNYHFLVVGNGLIRPTPDVNLTWIPFIHPERMALVYRAADVFFLPSHSEGFPLAILEAMASGLPVVTSKGQTFGEILEREGAGALSERNPSAFCRELRKILESPEVASSMKLCSRNLVERDYSILGVVARYRELVEKVAFSRKAP